MKDTFLKLIMLLVVSSIILGGCQPNDASLDTINDSGVSFTDTIQTRDLPQKRFSVKEAFLKLSSDELLLDGLQNMSIAERKTLLQSKETANYTVNWIGNYLQITEKPSNPDDVFEQVEQIRLAIFNSLKQRNVLFVSQELIDESRQNLHVMQQDFYQFKHQRWEDINQQLPLITTKTFLENDAKTFSPEDYFYFEPNPLDINYLQAILIHEKYPNKNEVASKEAYKVALVWNGDEFILDRQSMVHYNISEHHPH
ncbi:MULTISPECIES: hypothetical protein [unclassified Aureispira]|uniref:hypothetical protein n=1 Tax=unclassified Aureispira TaxID=2649989 RepID=UPI00069891DF|nr:MULTISPECIES: hypothetical protein [unclassified Aureispira]WMX14308.1 hypothetical protein QP953_25980 [Aureispira sp. CCB-E]